MPRTVIPLKHEIIYGPVDSRRLGKSLGLNILHPKAKLCSLDCLYCQYGNTRFHAIESVAAKDCPGVDEIEKALIQALDALPEPEYLTLSGNGEPTIHPQIGDVVDMMNTVRSRLAPNAKTAVLSNSTTVDRVEVRKALERLDVRIMKLDAGNRETFDRFNGPCAGVDFESVVDGLTALGGVTIQTLFTGGSKGNLTEDNINDWIACLKRIDPIAIQIYSLDRGTLTKEITKVPLADLERVSERLTKLGFNIKAYARESD